MSQAGSGKYLKKIPKPGGGYTYVYPHDAKTHGGTAFAHHDAKKQYHAGIAKYHERDKNNALAVHHLQVALAHKRAAQSAKRTSSGGGGLFGKPAGTPAPRKKTGTGIFGQKEKMSDLLGPKKPAKDDVEAGREAAVKHIAEQARTNPHLKSFPGHPSRWKKKDVLAKLSELEGNRELPARSAYRALTNWMVEDSRKTLDAKEARAKKGGLFVDLVKAWRN